MKVEYADLLGRRFRRGSCDCWTTAKSVLQRCGLALPDEAARATYDINGSSQWIAEYIARVGDIWARVDGPERVGDVGEVASSSGGTHLYTVVDTDRRLVITSTREGGVHTVRWDDLRGVRQWWRLVP